MGQIVDLTVYKASKELNVEFSSDGSPILRPGNWGLEDHIEQNSDLVKKTADFYGITNVLARSLLYVADESLMSDYKTVKSTFDDSLSKNFKNIDVRIVPLAKDIFNKDLQRYVNDFSNEEILEEFVGNYSRLVLHEIKTLREKYFGFMDNLYSFGEFNAVFAFGIKSDFVQNISLCPNIALMLMKEKNPTNDSVLDYSFKLNEMRTLETYLSK